MSNVSIPAHFDGEHILLDEPLTGTKHQTYRYLLE